MTPVLPDTRPPGNYLPLAKLLGLVALGLVLLVSVLMLVAWLSQREWRTAEESAEAVQMETEQPEIVAASPRDLPSLRRTPIEAPSQPPPLSPEQVLTSHCGLEWPYGLSKREACKDRQRKALLGLYNSDPGNMSRVGFDSIRARCAGDWPSDYQGRLKCEESQIAEHRQWQEEGRRVMAGFGERRQAVAQPPAPIIYKTSAEACTAAIARDIGYRYSLSQLETVPDSISEHIPPTPAKRRAPVGIYIYEGSDGDIFLCEVGSGNAYRVVQARSGVFPFKSAAAGVLPRKDPMSEKRQDEGGDAPGVEGALNGKQQ